MLPKDPNILFSLINTRLRDSGLDLDALCDDAGEDRSAVEAALLGAGYAYSAELNRFVRKDEAR